MMKFTRPSNGYTVRIEAPRFFTFLFGPLYFAAHGIWSHAVVSLVAAIFTFGLSWLIYPVFAPSILERAYLGNDWCRPGTPAADAPPASTPTPEDFTGWV